jgi:hypothetical protein
MIMYLYDALYFRNLFTRYELDKVEGKKEFETKLDKAILGLENDITEKRKHI